MAHYNVVLADQGGNTLWSITEYETIQLEFPLRDYSRIPSVPLDGLGGPQVEDAQELIHDLIVYRDGEKLFRGRINYSQDSIGPERHTTQFSAVDYRGMLHRRILWEPRLYGAPVPEASVDQTDIAWDLINYTQALPNGDLGITRGSSTPTGRTRDREYEAGQVIGSLLDNLSDVIDGFDYEVSPEKVFNLYYPERGTEKNFPLILGGNIQEVIRTVSAPDFANAIRASGAEPEHDPESVDPPDPAPVVTVEATNIATAPEGRFEAQMGFPDVTRVERLQEHAEGALSRRGIVSPGYSILIDPTKWRGPEDLWLGDTVELVIRSGRLDVVTPVRIMGVKMFLYDNDHEDIRFEANRIEPNLSHRMMNFQTRLEELERR
jgi:hypothetical protein